MEKKQPSKPPPLCCECTGQFIGKGGTRESIRSRASNHDARLQAFAVETRHLSCFCGNPRVVHATPQQPAAHFRFILLSAVLLGFQIWAPDFDKTTLQG